MPVASPEEYFDVMSRERPGVRAGNLRFGLERLFEGVQLGGARVLDIGAGAGHVSLYAAAMGAAEVVGLEPEGAGSGDEVTDSFRRLASLLRAEDVRIEPVTLQDYDQAEARFDVLLLLASINHLDEDACIRLHRDREARARYLALLRKLATLASDGARLVVSDCSRHNLFPRVGVRNPIASTIEWHKHQSPRLWAELLGEAGFRDARIRWDSPNTLRTPGRVLLGNRIGAYMLTSVFTLTMTKA